MVSIPAIDHLLRQAILLGIAYPIMIVLQWLGLRHIPLSHWLCGSNLEDRACLRCNSFTVVVQPYGK